MANLVHISSLDRIGERVIDHLRQGHHTALVGCPGCGITTFVAGLADSVAGNRPAEEPAAIPVNPEEE